MAPVPIARISSHLPDPPFDASSHSSPPSTPDPIPLAIVTPVPVPAPAASPEDAAEEVVHGVENTRSSRKSKVNSFASYIKRTYQYRRRKRHVKRSSAEEE